MHYTATPHLALVQRALWIPLATLDFQLCILLPSIVSLSNHCNKFKITRVSPPTTSPRLDQAGNERGWQKLEMEFKYPIVP